MHLKEELNKVLLTLNEVQVKGAQNISYLLGAMQKVQELIELCGDKSD